MGVHPKYVLLALGILSGLLSVGMSKIPSNTDLIHTLTGPGAVFGVVLAAYCLYRLARTWWSAIMIFLGSIVAYELAVGVAIKLHGNSADIVTFGAAGFVGGLILAAALCVALRFSIWKTGVLATAGAVLAIAWSVLHLSRPFDVLFIIWQAGYAFTFGWISAEKEEASSTASAHKRRPQRN